MEKQLTEKEISEAINNLLTDNGYKLEVKRSIAHNATHHLLDPIAVNLVLSTLKHDIVLTKITTNEIRNNELRHNQSSTAIFNQPNAT